MNLIDHRQQMGHLTNGSPTLTGEQASGLTVWIARSHASLANDVAQRLRGLAVSVQFWEPTFQRTPPHASDNVAVQDLAHMARRHGDRTVNMPTAPACRGGLAPGALRRTLEHIERQLSERVEINELANLAGLSDCHFARAFRQSVGVPPHRYVMTRRLEIAADLIANSQRALTDIALEVGFSDHSHFTRTFARMKGETPGAYRRRHR